MGFLGGGGGGLVEVPVLDRVAGGGGAPTAAADWADFCLSSTRRFLSSALRLNASWGLSTPGVLESVPPVDVSAEGWSQKSVKRVKTQQRCIGVCV